MSTNSMQARASPVQAQDEIRRAQLMVRENRRVGLSALNELFRSGSVPVPPLDGPYEGELIAVDIAPGVTQFIEWITSFLMPWKGKFLVAAESKGDNIFGSRWRTF